MKSEFELAEEDGRGLSFAASCLVGALRQMPTHSEGRCAIVNHAVVIGMIVPMAALLISGFFLGFPFLLSGRDGIQAMLAEGGNALALLNDGNRATAPALALLVSILTGGHLLMAWVILERDWTRICFFARVNAAVTTTLFIVSGVIFLDSSIMIIPILAIFTDLVSALALFYWNAQFSLGDSSEIIDQ